MRKLIFAFVGPSGCGKTTVMEALLKKHKQRLGFVKTVTTRPSRAPEEAALYTFVSTEQFMELLAANRLLQQGSVYYAGNWYDNDRADVDAVFAAGKVGICALVENSVTTFREAGYEVIMVRIKPLGAHDGRSEERRVIDQERERGGPKADAVIVNDFTHPKGATRVVASAESVIRRFAKDALRPKAKKSKRKK
jgi:guanylate kinase